jgi:hypothetical protein
MPYSAVQVVLRSDPKAGWSYRYGGLNYVDSRLADPLDKPAFKRRRPSAQAKCGQGPSVENALHFKIRH